MSDEVKDVKTEIAILRQSIATLADGKLDKRDLRAAVNLFGALAGLGSALYLLLANLGLLGS